MPVTSFSVIIVETSGSAIRVHVHEIGPHGFLVWSWQDVAN
jgi:hypothetical protein